MHGGEHPETKYNPTQTTILNPGMTSHSPYPIVQIANGSFQTPKSIPTLQTDSLQPLPLITKEILYSYHFRKDISSCPSSS